MTSFEKTTRLLFWSSIVIAIVVLTHLVVVYFAHDATIHPDMGGTVTIGLIGDPPSLNPALYGTDPVNDLVLRYLFRSLLRYNAVSGEMVGDLGNCDLGKDYSLIKCYVKSGNTWSDGTPITKQDILDTYSFLHDYSDNHSIHSILSQIDVTDRGDYIEFHSHNADVHLLDIFTLPILRSDIIALIGTKGSIPTNQYISSGPYVLTSSQPDTINSKNITLLPNGHRSKDAEVYVGRYVFRFFSDARALSQNEDILNIIYGQDVSAPKSLRFARYDYLLPEYIGLFLNSENIPVDMRGLILSELSTTEFPAINTNEGMVIHNVFFGNNTKDFIVSKKNPPDIFAGMGYFNEDGLINLFDKDAETNMQPQIVQKSLGTNTYIQFPTNQKIFFFSGALSDGLAVSGNVPDGTSAVYVGSYQLQEFKAGDTTFSYRIRDDIGNIHEGENTYVVGFEKDDSTRIAEEKLTVYAYTDLTKLAAKQKEIELATTIDKPLPSATLGSIEQKKQQLIDQVQKLEQPYYYNRDFKSYTLHLVTTAQS